MSESQWQILHWMSAHKSQGWINSANSDPFGDLTLDTGNKTCFDFILCWDKAWKGGIESFYVKLWASFVVLSSWGEREEDWGGAGDRYIRLVFPLTYTKLKSGRKKVIYSKLSQLISDETSLRWINFFR